jgi:hypothetical protein
MGVNGNEARVSHIADRYLVLVEYPYGLLLFGLCVMDLE